MRVGFRFALVAGLIALGACGPRGGGLAGIPTTPAHVKRWWTPDPPPSFNCVEAASTVQDFICATPALSRLDRDLAIHLHQRLSERDLFEREAVIADQRRWLAGRALACGVPAARLETGEPPAPVVECLTQRYQARDAALAQLSAPAAPSGAGLAAYVRFVPAEDQGAGCGEIAAAFNQSLADHGAPVDSARVGGTDLPPGLAVSYQDAGQYGGYQWRPTGVTRAGAPLLTPTSLLDWIRTLPNAGGRFGVGANQTRDYGALSLFRRDGRPSALLIEAWDRYSPAPPGEPAYAGLFDLADSGPPARVCLFKTALSLPVGNPIASLGAVSALQAALADLVPVPAGLATSDQTEAAILAEDSDWLLLNRPLIALDRAKHHPGLRDRHDQMLDRLWDYSERGLEAKSRALAVFGGLAPAATALARFYQASQGLTPAEADGAAGLVIMVWLDRALADLPESGSLTQHPPHRPAHYPIAASAADLESGRDYRGLYDAVLNQAPIEIIADYVHYELGPRGHGQGHGAEGETALMAAVDQPAVVRLLLQAGVDPDGGNDWHRTPLMLAAERNRLASVKLLLQAGADPNGATLPPGAPLSGPIPGPAAGPVAGPVPDPEADPVGARVGGRTALMVAAAKAGAAVIQLLLDHGADPSRRDQAGGRACDELGTNDQLDAAARTSLHAALCTTAPPS